MCLTQAKKHSEAVKKRTVSDIQKQSSENETSFPELQEEEKMLRLKPF